MVVLAAQCGLATAQLRNSTHRVSENSRRLPFGSFVHLPPKNVVVRLGRQNLRLMAKTDDDEGGNLGDDMLDFLYAGKKLRKWYGQEGQVLPKENQKKESSEPSPSSNSTDSSPKDTILVLEGDRSPMAEQVLLQLILARSKVKALVRDQQTAQAGFGPYVECLGGNTADGALVRRACRGIKAIILCGDVSASVLSLAAESGVTHVVLLSAVGAPPRGGFSLFGVGAEMALLENAKREELVKRSGMAYTIIRIEKLVDTEGGVSELQFQAGQDGSGGVISREDAALVLAKAAERDAVSLGSVVLTVAAGSGQPPEDWQRLFKELCAQPASS